MDATGTATVTAGTTAAAAAPTTAHEAVKAFYRELLFRVAPWGAPTRPSQRNGFAWCGYGTSAFHYVLVVPYLGEMGRTHGYHRLLPRITVNHYDYYGLSQARQALWSSNSGLPRFHRWRKSERSLELTCTLEELIGLAPWIAAWSKAQDLKDPSRLPAIPCKMETELARDELFRSNYEWTAAGSAEWKQRRPRRAARASGELAR